MVLTSIKDSTISLYIIKPDLFLIFFFFKDVTSSSKRVIVFMSTPPTHESCTYYLCLTIIPLIKMPHTLLARQKKKNREVGSVSLYMDLTH